VQSIIDTKNCWWNEGPNSSNNASSTKKILSENGSLLSELQSMAVVFAVVSPQPHTSGVRVWFFDCLCGCVCGCVCGVVWCWMRSVPFALWHDCFSEFHCCVVVIMQHSQYNYINPFSYLDTIYIHT
jgi:hypothetical protein